ncbi:hypothetical protein [Phyllobacterium sp. P30BS-XVII]|uniref:hypothetical protein n=1 Tax=Phyllobacterium sp. P30BS-XVII TaxID=2587046 RepID=UPI0015FD5855|nr:hypothetical protein [Phyllobacterium sp. P30BS-XVII]MBA8902713.1 hypothetical protein [Phyllobacterium sp. P30BS-XVII]
MNVVRGSWFDKLTMRERGDERESFSATLAIIVADLTLPHGELVEGRDNGSATTHFQKNRANLSNTISPRLF